MVDEWIHMPYAKMCRASFESHIPFMLACLYLHPHFFRKMHFIDFIILMAGLSSCGDRKTIILPHCTITRTTAQQQPQLNAIQYMFSLYGYVGTGSDDKSTLIFGKSISRNSSWRDDCHQDVTDNDS